MAKVILASGSPRRKEILTNLGIGFHVVPFQGKEHSNAKSAEKRAGELAVEKLNGVVHQLKAQGEDLQNTLVIAADTVVVHQLKIMGKPRSRQDAFDMIQRLQGGSHFVVTALALQYGDQRICDTAMTKVCFASMTEEEIQTYIQSGEYRDKAGGYGVQGYGAQYITGIVGDYFNVVGFPVRLFYTMLCQLGITVKQLQK